MQNNMLFFFPRTSLNRVHLNNKSRTCSGYEEPPAAPRAYLIMKDEGTFALLQGLHLKIGIVGPQRAVLQMRKVQAHLLG